MLLLESKVFSPLLHPQFLCPLVCKTPPFPLSVLSPRLCFKYQQDLLQVIKSRTVADNNDPLIGLLIITR